MQTKNYAMKRFIPVMFTGVVALLLTSCGTYNNGYGETDGIYSSESATTETAESTNKSNYYKQYFESKEDDYDNLPEEDLIFTDIEAYSTTESLDEEGYVVIEESEYNDGYGGWGNNSENITVNVYNTGGYYWHSPYWTYWGFYPYWYNPYWSIGYGWGHPYWYGYYGYGHFYRPYPYYYGGGYYAGGYYGGYHNGYASYNRGRRNTDYNLGRSSSNTRRSSYTRSELNRRSNNNSVRRSSNNTVRRNSNTVRRNSGTDTRRNNSVRPSNTRVQRNNSSTTPRMNTRSSSNRSSGTMRSSGSSSRSSGSRGGGSRGGGRRGGGL